MGWLIGGGLLVAIIVITAVFFIGKKRSEPACGLREPDSSLPDVFKGDPVELTTELESYIREENFKSVSRIVDFMETHPPEKQDEIRRIIIDSGFIKHYKTDLADIDYKTRILSVERLGKLGGDGVPELLFKAMADKNEEVRLAATAALKKQGDPAISHLLVGALKEPYKWLPARVAEVLVALDRAALPALQGALDEKDPVFRSYVIEIMGEIGDSSSAETLYPALRDANSNIRLQAARALGKIRCPGSANFLLELLNDSEVRVRVQAIRSLGRIGEPASVDSLTKMLNHPDAVIRYAAKEALGNMGREGPVKTRDSDGPVLQIKYE